MESRNVINSLSGQLAKFPKSALVGCKLVTVGLHFHEKTIIAKEIWTVVDRGQAIPFRLVLPPDS
jgi:hypothetical protein